MKYFKTKGLTMKTVNESEWYFFVIYFVICKEISSRRMVRVVLNTEQSNNPRNDAKYFLMIF